MIRTMKAKLVSTVAASLILLVGCGDYPLNPGTFDWDEVDARAGFEGAELELARYSTNCDRMSKSIKAKVHDGIEFSGDDVRTLECPCAMGPNPYVEVRMDPSSRVVSSLVFDFSAVRDVGRFPSGEFDGFAIDVNLHEDNALLLAATLDRQHTTLDLEQSDIDFGPDHIDINFEDVSYDRDGMVEIQLWFANVDPSTVVPTR